MNIAILRHGLTDYRQRYCVTIEEADDLRLEAIPIIKNSAKEIGDYIGLKPQIISSPYGRTVHTAKIAAEILDVPNREVVLVPELEDAHGLDFDLLLAFAEGGVYKLNGENITIDSRDTNPNKLSYVAYFNSDLTRNIPVSAKHKLPVELIEKMERLETCTEACFRLENVLKKIDRNSLVVTHQGLTQRLLEKMGYSHEEYLDRGQFIIVDANKGVLNPIYWSEKN